MDLKRLLSALWVAAALLGLPLHALAATTSTSATSADAAADASTDAATEEDGAEADADEALAITEQPADTSVRYPDGATFHVAVSDPEQAVSYQWVVSTGSGDVVLGGVTATTDTLAIPSTRQDMPDLSVRCVITAVDGSILESEPATLHVANADEDRDVLYVGDRALLPGQVLNLATTTLGSGKVTFDLNGIDITLDNVRLSTETLSCGLLDAHPAGICLACGHGEHDEHRINLVGSNAITVAPLGADGTDGGVALDMVAGAGNAAVVICGEGSLELAGGSRSIHADADVRIEAQLAANPGDDRPLDAIACRNLIIDDGAHVAISCNGTALRITEDLRLGVGVSMDVQASALRAAVGSADTCVVRAGDSIYINGASFAVHGSVGSGGPATGGSGASVFTGISYGGDLNVRGGAVSVEMEAPVSDDDLVAGCYGIRGVGEASELDLAGASSLKVIVNAPTVVAAGAIATTGALDVGEGCSLEATASSAGETPGIRVEGTIAMADAMVTCVVSSTNTEAVTRGIECDGLRISCSGPGYNLHSTAPNGMALVAGTGANSSNAVVPREGYAPKKILVSPPAVVLIPATGEVNVVGVPEDGGIIRMETIYYPNDRSEPASEVEIGIPDPGGDVVTMGTMIIVVVGAFAYIATDGKRIRARRRARNA